MRHRLVLGLLATMALATTATPARAVDQEAIKRAIERGVNALRGLQRADGTWPYTHIGATALAGLTLLECGASEDDKDVQRAAEAIRKEAASKLTHTYSISLCILFLDRLGDPDDVPLIESLMVRLLAGQDNKTGGWTYDCLPISDAEVRRLEGVVKGRKKEGGRREEGKPGSKRKAEELTPEIKDQLERLARGQLVADQEAPGRKPLFGPLGGERPLILNIPGDNSNTQFASLAIWVGRRYGLPVETAVERIANRFRTSQEEDGGWSYIKFTRPAGMPGNFAGMSMMGSTAAMTCAGVLGLAIADGAFLEKTRDRKPDAKVPDINSDKHLGRGLEALGAVIGDPKGLRAQQANRNPFAPPVDKVGGRTYYFLWSLERVAVALDLQTIGKKDWYSWGAEILLENQSPDGTWAGDHAEGGVDTCFALLFLKRANLARDLTTNLKGKVQDPGERMLRGGVGLNRSKLKKMKSGIETLSAKPIEKPVPKATDTEGAKMAAALLQAPQARQMKTIAKWESDKGSKNTEALATAIPSLEGETRKKAREALASRLARMKDETLAEYLQDEDAEIRRAAAIAIGEKDSKGLISNLIGLLSDSEMSVVNAAHASLKLLTGKDFGPSAKAPREERDKAVLKWFEWWSKQRKKATGE